VLNSDSIFTTGQHRVHGALFARCRESDRGTIFYLIRVRSFAWALDRRESEYLFGDVWGPWAGEQLSRTLSVTTKKHLGVRLRVAGWRHMAIGIATRHLVRASKMWEKEHEGAEDGGEGFSEGGDEEELELDTFLHVIVRQSGHGRHIAQAYYAIDGAFLHPLGPELVSAYEHASVAWYALWKLSERTSTGLSMKNEEWTLTEKTGERLKHNDHHRVGHARLARSRKNRTVASIAVSSFHTILKFM
jgi:hypothetical protein